MSERTTRNQALAAATALAQKAKDAAAAAVAAAKAAEDDAFNAAFESLSTITNDAEPGTLKHTVIEFINHQDEPETEHDCAENILTRAMVSEAEGGCRYSTVPKLVEEFFERYYADTGAEEFTDEQVDMVVDIFKAWAAKATAAELW